MTVRELIELNQMIVDAEITIRNHCGGRLLDQLNIGLAEGIKPPYPQRVPKNNKPVPITSTHDDNFYKDAAYIRKSINSWDDGQEYYCIKLNRIPSKWLELEVASWEVLPASSVGVPRRSNGRTRKVNFYGVKIKIETLPSGQIMEVKEKKEPEEQIEGQMNLTDWIEERGNT